MSLSALRKLIISFQIVSQIRGDGVKKRYKAVQNLRSLSLPCLISAVVDEMWISSASTVSIHVGLIKHLNGGLTTNKQKMAACCKGAQITD